MRFLVIIGLVVVVVLISAFFLLWRRKALLRIFFQPATLVKRPAPGGGQAVTAGGQREAEQKPVMIEIKGPEWRGKELSYKALAAATRSWSETCELGRGTAATVYRAHLSHFGTVALKRFNHERHEANRDFARELNALSSCRHQHILEILGYCFEGSEKIIAMPLMEGGTLGLALPRMQWGLRAVVMGQVVRATAFLHAKQVIHRDIKSSNILLDRSLGHSRLADFGLAKDQAKPTGGGSTGIVVGSLGYMAPELMMRPASEKTDAYAIGVVHLEILTGLPAWDDHAPENEDQALVDRVVADGAFLTSHLDARASWDEKSATTCASKAVQLTLFDPSKRCKVTALEADFPYREFLEEAAAACGAASAPCQIGRSSPSE